MLARRFLILATFIVGVACVQRESARTADTSLDSYDSAALRVATGTDSVTAPGAASDTAMNTVATVAGAPRDTLRRRNVPLPPLADSIADKLVFTPTNQSWFVAAARGKRMLIDIGRVDMEVRKDPARLAAYKVAVAARSPIREGARFRLHGPWGADDAVVTGYDTWNGRIVAVIETSPRVDSLSKAVEPLPAAAVRVDTATPPVADTCVRDTTLPPALAARATIVRDSVEAELRKTETPPYERLVKSVKSRATQVRGCFGSAQLAVIVTLWAGEYEWVRQRAVLVPDTGAVVPLRVRDYRFKAHEPIYALDGDGDGIDDIAARGFAERSGGMVVLKLAEKGRLERLAGGFMWESR